MRKDEWGFVRDVEEKKRKKERVASLGIYQLTRQQAKKEEGDDDIAL